MSTNIFSSNQSANKVSYSMMVYYNKEYNIAQEKVTQGIQVTCTDTGTDAN